MIWWYMLALYQLIHVLYSLLQLLCGQEALEDELACNATAEFEYRMVSYS